MTNVSHIVRAIAYSVCGIAIVTTATLGMKSHDNALYITLAVIGCACQVAALAVIWKHRTPNTRQATAQPLGTHARGFTMLEVMVAIAIITVVLGLLVAVTRPAFDAGKMATTRTNLAAVRSIAVEMSLKPLPPLPEWSVGGVLDDHADNIDDRPRGFVVFRTDATRRVYPMTLSGKAIPASPSDWTADELVNTVMVWQSLQPHTARRFPTVYNGSTFREVEVGGVRVSVAVDGWGNPLIFCPASGMTTAATYARGDAVRLADGAEVKLWELERAGKWIGQPGDGYLLAAQTWPLRREWGFFSAGPDGNPATWADNVWATAAN